MPLAPGAELIEQLRGELPELPAARIERFQRDHGLPPQYATDLNAEARVADYFEAVADGRRRQGRRGLGAEHGGRRRSTTLPAATLAALVGLVVDGAITNTIAKQVYDLMVERARRRPGRSWSSSTAWRRSATAPSWRRWWTR